MKSVVVQKHLIWRFIVATVVFFTLTYFEAALLSLVPEVIGPFAMPIFFTIAFLPFFVSLYSIIVLKKKPFKEQGYDVRKFFDEIDENNKLLLDRDKDLVKANTELKHLDKMKSEFLSVVAHQLRTPLSGFKWTLNLLLGGDVGKVSKEQKELLEKAEISNNQMLNILNNMLGADRVKSGTLECQFEKGELEPLVDRVIYDISAQAAEKGIDISFKRGKKKIGKFDFDPVKIQSVLQNLVENAIKYTPKGSIEVSMSKKKTEVTVSVKDSGIGIPKDQEDKMFTRFYRGSNAVREVSDGTGLGLFIAKGIIEAHQGKIWFETKENKGTTFFFTLPIH
jgi:signal transduction histidine kinase